MPNELKPWKEWAERHDIDLHDTDAKDAFEDAYTQNTTRPNQEDLAEELADRLMPYAQGCFSGNVAEWPQLKPLLADIHSFLSKRQGEI